MCHADRKLCAAFGWSGLAVLAVLHQRLVLHVKSCVRGCTFNLRREADVLILNPLGEIFLP